MNVLDVLQERGFVAEMTHPEELRDALGSRRLVCYIGFDPTASSLHVGSLVPIMALAHMQRNGHLPIALMGGGTGLVGDPSGKTEMRKLITVEDVNENVKGIRGQLERFIDFAEGRAKLENNAEWLLPINYIEFLRDIGRYFSVNRMIKAESYKMRLDSEDGLSFIEFNYMLLQAYDFLQLFDKHQCVLQMGGSDQWGNIVAGIDLVRRVRNAQVYGLTFPLITTSSGAKMGKTAAGAVWLDSDRTSPYEYYQYWINTHDDDVARFLALFTFLPMEEINRVKSLAGADLNAAKTILAFEATTIAHGMDKAIKAHQDTIKKFGVRNIPEDLLPSSAVPRDTVIIASPADLAFSGSSDISVAMAGEPQTKLPLSTIKAGISAVDLFNTTGLAQSKGAARRLIQQGGVYINGQRLESVDYCVTADDIRDGEIVLRAGKKKYHTIRIQDDLKA
ncbi:MAG: tyrosine--tRNA ligase [Thermodesulfobacteriota bacterium]